MSTMAHLSGRRQQPPISLKTYRFLPSIGETISGHAGESPVARAIRVFWRPTDDNAKALLQKRILVAGALVTTFYTYPQPRPCTVPGQDASRLAREIDVCGLSLTLQNPHFDLSLIHI